ncbi:MAG TPA: 50S ribosomal protein L18 [Dehalococcoidia bacterium]|jgi:large subunit ribosomal protein L18|nr:50S ribosomal protein L18 [Dehalococcoidia bacterium]
MKKSATMRAARIRRHARVRRKVQGSSEKPRLCVFRSLSHIYAQVIDDVSRTTLASASDVEKDVTSRANGKKKADVATIVGTLVAERAKQKGISRVVFDRGGYPFHGRIKALAEAARAGGLDF